MVDYSVIPEPVRDLLRERVHAFEHLEILLRMKAEAPGALGVDALTSALRIPESLVEPALVHLAVEELLVATAPRTYRYAPASASLDEAVSALAVCYADSRVELFRLISSNAIERLRSGSLKIFAEAFRLRRKKKDG
ncbi:MAG: hypothetical protein ABW252_14850 [Polyangiales bacterium]